MAQKLNTRRLVQSLDIQASDFLLPLLEVVVNSIQSIEDMIAPEYGKITVKIFRNKQISIDENGFEEVYKPVTGFLVTDNGVGFISERYNAFQEAFTDINIDKGCKGVGRYTVLACFNNMVIDSTFRENNKIFNRSFKFDLHDDINPDNDENLKIIDSEVKSLNTKILLNDYKEDFYNYGINKRLTKESISETIIQHCLLYFINESAPLIIVHYEDEPSNNGIILNDIFNSIVKLDRKDVEERIGTLPHKFILNYVRNNKVKSHSIHLCANNRQVGEKINLANFIPSFIKPLPDENNENYFLNIYVTGKFLDEKVNNQRNKFSIPNKDGDKNIFDSISIDGLCGQVSQYVCEEYSEWINEAEKERDTKVKSYILNPKNPRLTYKHLIEVEGAFGDIPVNASDEKIETELHKKVYSLEVKRKKEFDKIFQKKKYDKDAFGEIIHNILKEEAAFSQGKLGDLMIRRKSVIKLFKKYLEWNTEEKYLREEDLHNIIFTMGAESNKMPNDYHNLWLLDERLSFYSYTTSDKQLRTNPHINCDSQRETDLLIYDFPWAYSDNPDNINSLVVFEFKRPGRDMNSTDDRKLDSQIQLYFEKLMFSKSKSDKGKLLNVEKPTSKFGYVICELDRDLIEFNIDFNGFKKTPHGTLFKINEPLNQYIEVMSFEHMVDFAEKRHLAFFKALGIESI